MCMQHGCAVRESKKGRKPAPLLSTPTLPRQSGHQSFRLKGKVHTQSIITSKQGTNAPGDQTAEPTVRPQAQTNTFTKGKSKNNRHDGQTSRSFQGANQQGSAHQTVVVVLVVVLVVGASQSVAGNLSGPLPPPPAPHHTHKKVQGVRGVRMRLRTKWRRGRDSHRTIIESSSNVLPELVVHRVSIRLLHQIMTIFQTIKEVQAAYQQTTWNKAGGMTKLQVRLGQRFQTLAGPSAQDVAWSA